VVCETRAVERDLVDPGGLGLLRDSLADRLSPAATLPPLPADVPSPLSDFRISPSADEALASTRVPSSEITAA
jgi:hypothetical protein